MRTTRLLAILSIAIMCTVSADAQSVLKGLGQRVADRAKEKLENKLRSSAMADVARQCGFRDPLYFSKMFKKKYGASPTHYRREKPSAPAARQEDRL